jgi:hypothetical protein
MVKVISRLTVPVLVLLYCGGVFSCSDLAGPEDPGQTAQTGGIRVQLPEVPGDAEAAGRSAVNPIEAASLYYSFTFTGPGSQVQTKTVRPWEERSFTVTAAPGNWNIKVDAYTEEYKLRGVGTTAVTVIAGAVAAAHIKMTTLTTIASYEELVSAINNSAKDEILVISSDFPVTDSVHIIHKQVTLIADSEDRTLWRDLDFRGSFFVLGAQGSLTLGAGNSSGGTLSLNGYKLGVDADTSLIRINSGGTLWLKDGAEIVDNRNASSASLNGGGVFIDGGILNMEGGAISRNTTNNYTSATSTGGGVYINSGTLTMKGGTISSNTATSSNTSTSSAGGGVYINSGTFNMEGGIINSNSATNYTSTISNGGGVYVGNGVFNMEGGTISWNTASNGGGVYVNRTFLMKGDVVILPSTISGFPAINGVYLASSQVIELTGELTQAIAANIIYPIASNSQVLSSTSYLSSGTPPNYTRFLINGVAGKIDATGKIIP